MYLFVIYLLTLYLPSGKLIYMSDILFDKTISDNHPIRPEVRRVLAVQISETEFEITRFHVTRGPNGLKEWGDPSGVIFDTTTGVYRWKSNNSVPPADAIQNHGIDQLPNFNLARHNEVRDADTDAFFAKYREAQANHVPDAEELFELRAAYGTGTTVVNVITGRTTKL